MSAVSFADIRDQFRQHLATREKECDAAIAAGAAARSHTATVAGAGHSKVTHLFGGKQLPPNLPGQD